MSRLEALSDRPWDLLVIGGGIFGVGVAREAALQGWSVALVEREDLGAATSSASSKLIHGGLRYLERCEFSLVREALQERAVLQRLAPHLVRPCPFLVPLTRGAPIGPTKLRAGLWLYDRLAGRPAGFRPSMLSAEALAEREPTLRTEGSLGAGLYFDWQAFDSRMVSEVALAARERGALIVTRAEAVEVEGALSSGFQVTVADRWTGDTKATVVARTVVATVGPWSDRFRNHVTASSDQRARLTSGVHVVVDEVSADHAFLLRAPRDGRVVFMIPFFGRTLLGTTDRDHSGDPADASVRADDIDYLLETANAALQDPIDRHRIHSAFVGLRTLERVGAQAPSAQSREQAIFEEPMGMLHILGGKLTTWRPIARRLVERAARRTNLRIDDGTLSRITPLPGGEPERVLSPRLGSARPPAASARMRSWFGARANDVVAAGDGVADGHEPIGPTLAETPAELIYLARVEGAMTLLDVLRRRLPRVLLNAVSPTDAARAAQILGGELAWDDARTNAEAASLVAAAFTPPSDRS